MIRIDNPLIVLVVFVLVLAGLFVYPAMKAGRIHLTFAKGVSLVLAVSICLYNGTFALLLVFLWPLSFIWFPKYWGNYTGFLRGPYIDEKSPAVVVALMGWFFLVAIRPQIWWIGRR